MVMGKFDMYYDMVIKAILHKKDVARENGLFAAILRRYFSYLFTNAETECPICHRYFKSKFALHMHLLMSRECSATIKYIVDVIIKIRDYVMKHVLYRGRKIKLCHENYCIVCEDFDTILEVLDEAIMTKIIIPNSTPGLKVRLL